MVRCPVLIISPWFWSKSFTLSMGAAADLATMAAAPPMAKSVENFSGFRTEVILLEKETVLKDLEIGNVIFAAAEGRRTRRRKIVWRTRRRKRSVRRRLFSFVDPFGIESTKIRKER